jgi:hypothetical protein
MTGVGWCGAWSFCVGRSGKIKFKIKGKSKSKNKSKTKFKGKRARAPALHGLGFQAPGDINNVDAVIA